MKIKVKTVKEETIDIPDPFFADNNGTKMVFSKGKLFKFHFNDRMFSFTEIKKELEEIIVEFIGSNVFPTIEKQNKIREEINELFSPFFSNLNYLVEVLTLKKIELKFGGMYKNRKGEIRTIQENRSYLDFGSWNYIDDQNCTYRKNGRYLDDKTDSEYDLIEEI